MADKREWRFLHAKGYKVLFISPDVRDLVLESVKADSEEIFAEEDVATAFVDMPGMCLGNRQYWEVDLDGLAISIPVTDVSDMLRQMREMREAPKFVDRGWYNVYGWHHCLSLSKDQYEKLISMMERDMPDISRRADEDETRLVNAIRAANTEMAQAGVKVQVVSPRLQKDPYGGEWN